ncbi:MAG TPA: hypothetical protein VNQ99_08800 [Xanthobacteraceae bacterium]|nr:hypothetical protein [Xanthobacteraceae bacterium]
MNGGLDVISVKAFGDLIIALTCIGRGTGADTADARVILGSHLVPLYKALGSSIPAVVLEHGEAGVPSFYDIRRNGMLAALRSGMRLRSLLMSADVRSPLFDRMSWRERFLAAGRTRSTLPPAENIYLAYQQVFGPIQLPSGTGREAGKRIGIFPGSRLAAKNLPCELVRDVQRTISELGGDASLHLLDGERPDLEAGDIKSVIIPRDFGAMIEAVRSCDAIVSADSMPAHLAELVGRPVFVFSPVDNRYWLPFSAFAEARWSLFAGDSDDRFEGFLRRMIPIDGE